MLKFNEICVVEPAAFLTLLWHAPKGSRFHLPDLLAEPLSCRGIGKPNMQVTVSPILFSLLSVQMSPLFLLYCSQS